jgi:hypothetical protein
MDLLIPKSVFLTCQIKDHDVNEDDRTKSMNLLSSVNDVKFLSS